jgi:ABC-type nitrate/sulfonate/bicarbonate transport system permease component
VESILIGWTAAAAIGIGLGLALGLSPLLRRWSLASFEVLRPLPAIAFLPLALLLFNFSLTTELVLMIYASVWPVFINTMGGVMGVTSRLYDVSRTLRLSRMQTLVKVIVPAAAPAIVTGCRLSMGLTLVMAIVAEMIANPHGLGYAVISELQAMQPQRMFAYVIFIGMLSIALNAGLLWVSRHILRSHRWAHADHA